MPEPMTFEQIEQIRKALADLDIVDNGVVGTQGRYGWSFRGVAKAVNMQADLELLLAEVDRLRELKCAVCGKRVAHLNHAGHVIGWGCADGDNCKDDRLVQARAAGWDEGYKSGVEDERTSADNIGIAGLGGKVSPARVNPYHPPASGMPRPPAEEAAPGSAADSRPETRTGVSETLSEAHVSEVPDVDGWTLHSRPGGMLLSHDTDADMPTLWSDGPMQLGAVLAFIADQEDPDA